MKNLEQYLTENLERKVTEYTLCVLPTESVGVRFYLHANGVDSDTLDFVVQGNKLIPLEEHIKKVAGRAGTNENADWHQYSAESIRERFPDREERISTVVAQLATYMAVSNPWSDLRHLSRIYFQCLTEDLGIDLKFRDDVFDTHAPLDNQGNPAIIDVDLATPASLEEAQKSSQIVLEALEDARHELTTLDGLIACDGAAPEEKFTIKTSRVLQSLDKAIQSIQPDCNHKTP